MKKLFKDLVSRVLMLTLALCIPVASDAYKLEVAKGGIIRIDSVGYTSSDGKFIFKDSAKKESPILIDEIVLTYENPTPGKFAIVNIDNDSAIFNTMMTINMQKHEMERLDSLFLSTDANYNLTHGEKSWPINFVELKTDSADTAAVDSAAVVPSGPKTDANSGSGTPAWVWILLAISVLVNLALLVLFLYRNGTFNKKAAETPAADGKAAAGPGKDANQQENISKPGETVEQAPASNPNDHILNMISPLFNLFPHAPQQGTVEDKINWLNTAIAALQQNNTAGGNANAAATQDMEPLQPADYAIGLIRDTFEIPGSATAEEMVDILSSRIDSNSQASQTNVRESFKSGKESYAESVIAKMEGKGKTLQAIVKKAKEECRGDDPIAVLDKVVNMLPSKLQSAQSPQPVQTQSLEISESQMNTQTGRLQMMRWAIGQIEMQGYKGLNKNGRTDEVFKLIADMLNQASSATQAPSEAEIITAAVLNNALQDDHKKVLLRRLIEKLNAQMEEGNRIDEKMDLATFLKHISGKMNQPNSFEDAQDQVRKEHLDSVNEVLDSDIQKLDRDSLAKAIRSALVRILNNEVSNLDTDNLDDAVRKLQENADARAILDTLYKEYDVREASDLVAAIKQKVYTDVSKSSGAKISELLPGQHIDSVQKLVNALMRVAEVAKEDRAMIAGDLEEKISIRDKDHTPGETDVLRLIEIYTRLVDKNEAALNKEIEERNTDLETAKTEIDTLNNTVTEKNEEISELQEKNGELMAESGTLVKDLHQGADKILDACRTILNPCSDSEEAQCVDIEDRLFGALDAVVRRLKGFNVASGTVPVLARKEIQDLLVSEISAENSAINTVCRYYAYSRLPFMTDTAREYGITFRRKNMADLYNAVENLYVHFGINLNVPSLFVMGIEEGEFENVTGRMYGDLDNLCQNSRNHFDNIDSATKPSNVIVDVVNIGYSIDGKTERVTSVITY